MIIEIPRKDFLQNIMEDNFPNGSSLAVCLFILPERLSQMRVPVVEQEKLIDYGKKILSVSEEGLFAQISWTTYFAFIHDEKSRLIEKLDKAKARFELEDVLCHLWQYAVREIDKREPGKTFIDLEWQSYEAAREDDNEF